MKIAWTGLAAALLLAACAPAAAPTAMPSTSTPVPPTAAAAAPTVDAPLSPVPAAASERPVWQSIALTDARTGETFSLADFAGRTVFVHPMAKW